MKSIISTVRIEENPCAEKRWRLHWDASSVEDHATAVEAQRAVQQRDKMFVESGSPVVVTTIEWMPVTNLGLCVVKALT